MQKIPSLFKRDYEGTRLIYDEIVEGTEWVQAGEGVATEKYDGTACLIHEGRLYRRHKLRQGRTVPTGWLHWSFDPATVSGHGWLPVSPDRPEDEWHREADLAGLPDWTYELVGPKIQGNPYELECHVLYRHGDHIIHDIPRDFNGLRGFLEVSPGEDPTEAIEGLVWHHPDGRMAKIKRKDFGLPWPIPTKGKN